MVNLEQLKTGPDAEREDLAYARVVILALLKHGSMPVYVGRVRGLLLGHNTSDFGRASIVRYRSLRDFLNIYTDPNVQSGVNHKFASTTYTEARPTSPVISLVSIQLASACIFCLIGLLGWIGLRPKASVPH